MTTERETRAARQFALLTVLRAAGVFVMLAGLWMWHGDIVREGGHAPLGSGIFFIGVVSSLVMPGLLVKHWRRRDGR